MCKLQQNVLLISKGLEALGGVFVVYGDSLFGFLSIKLANFQTLALMHACMRGIFYVKKTVIFLLYNKTQHNQHNI